MLRGGSERGSAPPRKSGRLQGSTRRNPTPPARGGSKLALRKPGFGMKLSKPRYVSCDRVAKLLRRERGWHDRIKTVSRPYQHINYTVSTVYQHRINHMTAHLSLPARRTCVSQRAESVHACARCGLATTKPPTAFLVAERGALASMPGLNAAAQAAQRPQRLWRTHERSRTRTTAATARPAIAEESSRCLEK